MYKYQARGHIGHISLLYISNNTISYTNPKTLHYCLFIAIPYSYRPFQYQAPSQCSSTPQSSPSFPSRLSPSQPQQSKYKDGTMVLAVKPRLEPPTPATATLAELRNAVRAPRVHPSPAFFQACQVYWTLFFNFKTSVYFPLVCPLP